MDCVTENTNKVPVLMDIGKSTIIWKYISHRNLKVWNGILLLILDYCDCKNNEIPAKVNWKWTIDSLLKLINHAHLIYWIYFHISSSKKYWFIHLLINWFICKNIKFTTHQMLLYILDAVIFIFWMLLLFVLCCWYLSITDHLPYYKWLEI